MRNSAGRVLCFVNLDFHFSINTAYAPYFYFPVFFWFFAARFGRGGANNVFHANGMGTDNLYLEPNRDSIVGNVNQLDTNQNNAGNE